MEAGVAIYTALAPLTLSLSPWERGRPLDLHNRPDDSLSHGERDGVRGGTVMRGTPGMAMTPPSAMAGTGQSGSGFSLRQYLICGRGIVWREALRLLHQRERFVSALVRPLVWLFIFAAGFRQALGIAIIPPYETYIPYEVYIVPGLLAMIQLFNGMQSSLSMVYDREMGNMRTLLVSPFPRWFLLSSKLRGRHAGLDPAGLCLHRAWRGSGTYSRRCYGYLTVLPALILTGLMLGALGMVLSSLITQLEYFAGIMNFVIFPMSSPRPRSTRSGGWRNQA